MLARSSLRRPAHAAAGAALVAALACASLGCAPPPALAPSTQPPLRSLRITDGDLDRAPRTVSAAEALRDLDDARYAFAHAYAGLDGRPPSPSPRSIALAERALRRRAAWRPDDFARLLRDLFAAPDGHLAFGYGGPAPLRLAAAPPRSPLLPSSGAPPVELTRTPSGVPVLAVRTFSAAAAPALEALPALAAELRRAPAFVVDLRGNAGGDYRYAERFALALTDAPLRALDEREVLSVAAAEGRANSARRRLARGDVPDAARPRFLDHLAALERLAAALRARPRGAAPRVDLTTRGAALRGRAPGPLAGRAVFLVDGGCASACEMLLALVRQIPGALVAGQNTRGAMSVGEVALFRLPRSGVTLSLGTRAFRDPLGGFAETRGFAPDVRLDGADPVGDAAALALGDHLTATAGTSRRTASRPAAPPG
ncbi:uncharacterized protein SOCE26_069610 [Sorangium cellulosum]|uniref:Tail specific protease domain-containing protein n=1 Tax=Sorangium cellulosum TaxID=56 RepID=A0A2L0F1N9_SORCE|nr:S41 family peptidase [Sorangium cellulosum]AUX45470.1 uncharacterized protein SOCE26_069610 [Sorangium cellulosum]